MAVKKDKETKTSTDVPRSGSEKARWFFGIIVFAAGVFAALSIISYWFDWKNDYSVLHPGHLDDGNKIIENVCGPAGAYIADALVGLSFGVFGILVPIMAMLAGIRILRRRPLFFNHSTLSLTFVLILGSLTLGLAFGKQWGIFGSGWGGAFGIFVAEWLKGTIGMGGIILVLVVGWIFTGVFINSNFINTVNRAGTTVVGGGEAVLDSMRGFISWFGRSKKTKVADDDTEMLDRIQSEPEVSAPQNPQPVIEKTYVEEPAQS